MKIINTEIKTPLFLAPMDGITDKAFRIICKRLGADVVFTEFVSSEGLIRNCKKAKEKIEFSKEEKPIGVQIYGSNEISMCESAKIIESFNPDFIDINLGCWVRNVVNTGAGAALLRDLSKIEKILSAVINSVKLPVSIKTRLGWDKNNIKIIEVAKLAEQLGVKWITIHCRTRDQQLKGEPDYSWIQKVKSNVAIPVIVNGSFDNINKIKFAFDILGADGVMIGRAAIGNPWIFHQFKTLDKNNNSLIVISLSERFKIIKEHLFLSVKYKGESRGVVEFRKYFSGYFHGLYGASKIRNNLMKFLDLESILKILTNYEEHLHAIQKS